MPGYLRHAGDGRASPTPFALCQQRIQAGRRNLDFPHVRALLRSYGERDRRPRWRSSVCPRDHQFASGRPPVDLSTALLLRARISERAKREIATGGSTRASPMIAAMLGQVLVQNREIPAAVRPADGRSPSPPTGSFTTICRRCCCGRKSPKRALASLEKVLPNARTMCAAGTRSAKRRPRRASKCGNTASPAKQYARQGNLRGAIDQFGWHRRLVMATTTKPNTSKPARSGCDSEMQAARQNERRASL